MDLTAPIVNGSVDPAYADSRPEVRALVPAAAKRVLDVGCSVGALAAALREDGHHVVGVEGDADLARMARARACLDELIEADVERLAAEGTDPGGPFDCVVLADVVEHLVDPWTTVRWAAEHLSPKGSLVISVPNVRHAQTYWWLLVRRRWPYKTVGIFDRTHLRWFARSNLGELLEGTGLQIVQLERIRMLVPRASRFNRLAPYLGDLSTVQFVLRAERRS